MAIWNAYNVFRRFCAFIIGMVFFLSGLLKLLDPVGAGLVVDEYYKFFHLGFLSVTAKCVGTVLAFLETAIGVALMSGLWRKILSIVTFSFLGVFTIITTILLIANPVMDCGCFGEAIHLTHLQSFIKNVILLGLAVVAFVPGRLGRPRLRKYVAFGIVCAIVLGFGIYSLLYIPLVDFTDFRPGARLEASVQNAASGYSAVFIYEKDGQESEFTLEDLPDSTWTYVRTETSRTDRSDDIIVPLSFSDRNGDYADWMAAYGDVMVFSIYKVPQMSWRQWEKVAAGVEAAREAGYTPLVLASADYDSVSAALESKLSGKGRKAADDGLGGAADGTVEDASAGTGIADGFSTGTVDEAADWYGEDYGSRYEELENSRDAVAGTILANLYTADYKTLLTMNRSNGGATYFRNGSLVTKWAVRAVPNAAKLSNILATDMAETVVETTTRQHLVYECLLVVAFGVLFFV